MKIQKFWKIIFGVFFVICTSSFFVYLIDKRLNKIFNEYIDIEVKKVSNNVVTRAVNNYITKEKYNDFLLISYNSNGEINKISYNTEKINNFTSSFSAYLEKVLYNLESGTIDDYYLDSRLKLGGFMAVKNSIVCNVSFGALTGSTLFSSMGPKIPIKIVFLGDINTDVEIKFEEYGINNIIVKMYLIVNVYEQASLPITSKEKKITIREIMAVDIIRGELPNYYSGFVK
jgi:sporulation protein YunB